MSNRFAIYIYVCTSLRIQLPLNYSVFFKVHTKGQLCSVRATLILRGATAFITRVLQATNTEHGGERRRDTRYRHCSMRKRSTWLRDVGFKSYEEGNYVGYKILTWKSRPVTAGKKLP